MKRLIAFILATFMLFAISACGKSEEAPKTENKPKQEIEVTTPENEPYEEALPPSDAPAVDEAPEAKPEEDNIPAAPEAKPEAKPEVRPETKPEAKPEVKPENKPSDKPAEPIAPPPAVDKPAEKPAEPIAPPPAEEKPAEKPEEKPVGTVGDALAADFRANASKSGMEIAEIVIKNSVIPSELPLMTMEVEEGYLTGFDNTQVTGFENGVMFAPGMGTIPFVGYVFTLPSTATVDAFVNILKSSANLRWNICTEAEQMIVEKSGNKVFFLMCPKSFEQ